MKREWLEKIRLDKQLSQEQMALILNLPQTTYSSYELGTRTPKVPEAKRISKILKINWQKFYEN